ncbi:MAG TPA: NYN domain-containing protein [Candidatus Limnocylindria bacterium]|nr:NYN domain-containing protein [Candidatus Limnocylindria bacterium]
MPDVALLIDWENVYYTMRQHTEGPLPSSLSILQAILQKAAEFGPVRVKQAIFGQEVAAQDETLLMALEFTGMEPVAVAQRMSGRLLKGRSDAVLITRTMKLLYKERPDIDVWFIVSGDRDLNALCKALKDEDKAVYLIAGDKALANELRESPYLRDGVFLLEDLIPEARWTRTGILRTDDTQAGKEDALPRRTTMVRGGTRGGRGRGPVRTAVPASVPPVVPSGSPESEKEQRRLTVLLLDQLVALREDQMPRGEFVRSVVPLSHKEASSVLDQRIDFGVAQHHLVATQPARTRLKDKQTLALNFGSPLVAETLFHLVRLLRRIDSVTSKDTRRIPAIEAVLEPLARADTAGGLAKGRSQRRAVLETLFSIAEERGAIATEQVARDGRQITMCWLSEGHPLVRYARQPTAAIVHLFNFVSSTRGKDDKPDWVNTALFSELLSRVEGDALESSIRRAVESGNLRPEEHGRKAGYAIDRSHAETRVVLGEFSRMNGESEPAERGPVMPDDAAALDVDDQGVEPSGDPDGQAGGDLSLLKPKRRRGRRGGRGRRKTSSPAAP